VECPVSQVLAAEYKRENESGEFVFDVIAVTAGSDKLNTEWGDGCIGEHRLGAYGPDDSETVMYTEIPTGRDVDGLHGAPLADSGDVEDITGYDVDELEGSDPGETKDNLEEKTGTLNFSDLEEDTLQYTLDLGAFVATELGGEVVENVAKSYTLVNLAVGLADLYEASTGIDTYEDDGKIYSWESPTYDWNSHAIRYKNLKVDPGYWNARLKIGQETTYGWSVNRDTIKNELEITSSTASYGW